MTGARRGRVRRCESGLRRGTGAGDVDGRADRSAGRAGRGGAAPSTSGILLREGTHGHTRQLSTVDRARWLAIVPPTSASGTPTLRQSAGIAVRLM